MADIDRIADGSALDIALAYRAGRVDPVELVECLLERIKDREADNIFITVMSERARAEAEASRKRYRSGMPISIFDGVPVAWKDLFEVAGSRTTAGSRLLAESPIKKRDMPCVQNLAAAGMVTIGKVNTAEFAFAPLGLNSHFGTPRNPHDPLKIRVPGGSSSGSAVAVGAKVVPCSIGTDTGGSVRVPAAFNGVVGYKTSTGRIDTTELIPLARSLDTIGPLARSVEDCILLDGFLQGQVQTPIWRRALRSVTFVAPTNVVMADIEPAVLRNFERSLEILARQGARIRQEKVEALDRIVDMTAVHGSLIAAEAYAEYRDLIESENVAFLDKRLVERIKTGKVMTARGVMHIQRERQRLLPLMHRQLEGALLCMPTTPLTAPELPALEASEALLNEMNQKAVRNTSLGNILEMCGLAVPNGVDGGGLPTSFLLSACHGDDAFLLSVGLEVERAFRQP